MSSYYNNFIPWIHKLNFLHFPPPHPKAGSCWNNNRFVCMQKVSWIQICQAFEQPWFSDSRNSMFNTHTQMTQINGWVGGLRMLSRYVILHYGPSKSHFVVVKIHTYPFHLHVSGETRTYPCLALDCATHPKVIMWHMILDRNIRLWMQKGETCIVYQLSITNKSFFILVRHPIRLCYCFLLKVAILLLL